MEEPSQFSVGQTAKSLPNLFHHGDTPQSDDVWYSSTSSADYSNCVTTPDLTPTTGTTAEDEPTEMQRFLKESSATVKFTGHV